MAISAEKVAPSAIVLAFVGYCAWPSLSALLSDPPKPPPPPEIQMISEKHLSPEMSPFPERNPWGGKDATTIAALKKEQEEAKKRERATLLAEMKAAKSVKKTSGKPAPKPEDLLKRLRLNGTSIGGGQSFAIINDRMYALNQLILESETGGEACKLIEITPHKVVLEYGGKQLELKYSNGASESTAAGASLPTPPREQVVGTN